MDVRRSNEGPEHLYAVVFTGGEDPIRGLEDFARTEGLASGTLTAVGTFRRAVVGIAAGRCGEFERFPVEAPCDVVVLVGTIAGAPGRPELCLRTVLGTSGGRALAGRLLEAEVSSILEVVVSDDPPRPKVRNASRLPAAYHPCLSVVRRRAP